MDTTTESPVILLGDGSVLDESKPPVMNVSDTESENSSVLMEDECEKDALRAELPPLSAEEQAAIDTAKAAASNAEPPTGANDADYELTATIKTINDKLHPTENSISLEPTIVMKPKLSSDSDKCSASKGKYVPNPSDFKETSVPHAANDLYGEHFDTFQTDWMKASVEQYEKIKVRKSTDANGRRFYMFDDGTNVNLFIMVFNTPMGEMLYINDTILPLDEFLRITHVRSSPPPKQKENVPNLEIRSALSTIIQGGVKCRVQDSDDWFEIKNSSVNQIMTALIFLTKEHNKPLASNSIPSSSLNVWFNAPPIAQPELPKEESFVSRERLFSLGYFVAGTVCMLGAYFFR